MTPEEVMKNFAEKYRDDDLKGNPNGYTVAVGVNSDTTSDAFEAGWRECLVSDPRVLALAEALELAIKQMRYTDSLDLSNNKTNDPTISIFLEPALAHWRKGLK